MKVLSVVGSPRWNGNTHLLSQRFMEGAKRSGAEGEEIFLSRLKVAPCADCGRCYKDGICRMTDDFGGVAGKMKASDGLLLSTPVYCCSVTGQMKAFMDRCHSFIFPAYTTGLEGKKAAFIIGSGYPPRKEDLAIAAHNAPIEVLFEIEKKIRVSTGDTLRCAIDPMKPFDSTVDTLRTLYQFCAFNRLEAIGFMEVTGLGNDKEAVRRRPDELQRAEEFGERFVEMLSAGRKAPG